MDVKDQEKNGCMFIGFSERRKKMQKKKCEINAGNIVDDIFRIVKTNGRVLTFEAFPLNYGSHLKIMVRIFHSQKHKARTKLSRC